MSTDLLSQLAAYGAYHDERQGSVSVDEVVSRGEHRASHDAVIPTLIPESAASGREPASLPHVDLRSFRPRRQGWLVAAATAAVVLIAIGATALFIGLARNEAGEVVTSEPTVTTAPAPTVTTTAPPTATTMPPAPMTTIPPEPEPPLPAPPTVLGAWTLFTTEHGLPEGVVGRIAMAPDGTVWAAVYPEEESDDLFSLAYFAGESWVTIRQDVATDAYTLFIPTNDGVFVGYGGEELRIAEYRDGDWIDHIEQSSLPLRNGVAVGAFGSDGILRIAVNDSPLLTLLEYDGTPWEIYQAEGIEGGPSVFTAWRRISISPSGEAWFVGNGALWRITPHGSDRFDAPGMGCCSAWVATTPEGEVWSTTGVAVLRWDGDALTSFTETDGLVEGTLHDHEGAINSYRAYEAMGFGTQDGRFWISEESGVSVFDGADWTSFDRDEAEGSGLPAPIAHPSRGAVTQGSDGSTWTLGVNAPEDPFYLRVHRYDGRAWAEVPVEVPLLNWTLFPGLVVTPDGSAWFAAEGGVARFTP